MSANIATASNRRGCHRSGTFPRRISSRTCRGTYGMRLVPRGDCDAATLIGGWYRGIRWGYHPRIGPRSDGRCSVTRFRAPAAVGVALVILVLTAGPAFARWKGLSDLNMDNGGHVCRSGVEFALAHFAPASESAEVRNVTADPDVVVVPSTPLARLVFSPVPERSATDPYYYSSIYRILFPKKVPAGTQLEIHFSGTSSAISATLAVADCRLGKP